MFGQKVEDLEKWAISLEEFKKKYDKKIGEKDVKRDINVRPSDSFPHFFNKLKDLNRDYFKVGATVSLRNITDRPINAFYDQIYCVFTKEGKETKRNVWKKNPGSVDITMNKKSARVTCRMEKGGTVIVVLTA